jgi:hypothetical protein
MKNDKREWLALYYDTTSKEWRLITREVATLKHAENLIKKYKSYEYITKLIKI